VTKVNRTSNLGGANGWVFRQEDYLNTPGWAQWWRTYNVAEGSAGGAPAAVSTAPGMATSSIGSMGAISSISMGRNWGVTKRLISHPAVIPPGFKEPLATGMGFCGRFRWVYAIQQGAGYQTFEGRKYMCIAPYNSASSYPGIMIGPWDQTSDPVQG